VLIVGVVSMIVFGLVGYKMGQQKDRATEGLLLGALLGVFGIVILYFLKPKQTAAAQTWGGVAGYGAPAGLSYGQQASHGSGQANVLPSAAAGPVVPSNPYAPIAETAGFGYEQPVPVATPQPAAPAVSAQWFADPAGRHQHRWWDGSAWTEHVADNGVVSVDAPQPAQPF
jgi:hypothetical protein